MRRPATAALVFFAVLPLLLASPAAAQQKPAVEVGLGLTTEAFFEGSAPLQEEGFLTPHAGLYLALFPTERLVVEPTLALTWGDGGRWSVHTGGDVQYHFAGVASSSLYVQGGPLVGFSSASSPATEGFDLGASAGLGYRLLLPLGLTVGAEARHVWWPGRERKQQLGLKLGWRLGG